MAERFVNYTLEIDGKLIVVENVPARIDDETGERFFSPDTVERLQEIVWSRVAPDRYVQAPVYRYVA